MLLVGVLLVIAVHRMANRRRSSSGEGESGHHHNQPRQTRPPTDGRGRINGSPQRKGGMHGGPSYFPRHGRGTK